MTYFVINKDLLDINVYIKDMSFIKLVLFWFAPQVGVSQQKIICRVGLGNMGNTSLKV